MSLSTNYNKYGITPPVSSKNTNEVNWSDGNTGESSVSGEVNKINGGIAGNTRVSGYGKYSRNCDDLSETLLNGDPLLSHTSLHSLRGQSRSLPPSRLLLPRNVAYDSYAHRRRPECYPDSYGDRHDDAYAMLKTNTSRPPARHLLPVNRRTRWFAGELSTEILFPFNANSCPNTGATTSAILHNDLSTDYDENSNYSPSKTPIFAEYENPSKSQEIIIKKYSNSYKEAERRKHANPGIEWFWIDQLCNLTATTRLSNKKRDCVFNESVYIGTAMIHGNIPLENDMQHFWEIKIMQHIYGTAVVVGIATEFDSIEQYDDCSLLGDNEDSYGYSCEGLVRYAKQFHNVRYSDFGKGCVIGIHLDLWNGQLNFFKNRIHIGVKYVNVDRRKKYYPAVSSSNTNSAIRILKTVTLPTTLQFLCCKVLTTLVNNHLLVSEELDMPPGIKQYVDTATKMLASDHISSVLDSRVQLSKMSYH